MALILAVLGAVLMVVAIAMVWTPAAVFWAGVECVTAAYVARYLEVKR